MARLYFITVLTVLFGCFVTGSRAAQNYTIVRLNATEALKDLISPNFPANYPIYQKIMYIITAQDSHSGIAIKFSTLNMEMSTNCEADSLKLYKANYEFKFLVKNYCGHKKPGNIFIPENNITLVFTTNAHQEKRGFRLKYYETRTNPFSKEKKAESNESGFGLGFGTGFGIALFLSFIIVCHIKKNAESKAAAEAKTKADAKKKADQKQKTEAEAKTKAETDAKQKENANKKEETKQNTKSDNQKCKCEESVNVETMYKGYQQANQSTQTLIQPLQPFTQSFLPFSQPTQPRTQFLPPINEPVPSISQHLSSNTLQSQAQQPLFHPIEMLYPSVQGQHSHPIHLVQPMPNTSSFTRQMVGTGASDETRINGLETNPPSYEALSFDYKIPETKLL